MDKAWLFWMIRLMRAFLPYTYLDNPRAHEGHHCWYRQSDPLPLYRPGRAAFCVWDQCHQGKGV